MGAAILGVHVDRVTMDEARANVQRMVGEEGPHLLVTLNSEMIVMANNDPLLFQIIDRADLVVADGIGVVWASRVMGYPLPERIPGVELATLVLCDASHYGWKVFLLGGEPGVAQKAAARVQESFPGVDIVGTHHGFFTKSQEQAVLRSIKQSAPDILLVALGAPKQEKWAAAHLASLQVPLAIGVGGTLDILAGTARRAPRFMRQLGIEWLYRLVKQPARIGRMRVLPQYVIWVLLERFFAREDNTS